MSAIGAVRDKRRGAVTLLGSRGFGPLFAAQFLSASNDNTLRNALVLMIAYHADAAGQFSAQIMIPLAAGLFMLPFFLCSATAGQIADEEDKAWLIRLIKLPRNPVMLAAAGGVLAGSADCASRPVNAAVVISSAATAALIAVGISIPGLFLVTGATTIFVAIMFWCMPLRFGA